MVKLQNLLFPSEKICAEQSLYYHLFGAGDTVAVAQDGALCPKSGIGLAFNAYFNLFSAGKWLKYTKVRELDLHLNLKGDFEVKLLHSSERSKILNTVELASYKLHAANRQTVILPYPPLAEDFSGVLSFSITAAGQDCLIYGGFYAEPGIKEPVRAVKMGIVICTYRREEFVKNNLAALRRALLKDGSELAGCAEIVVCDNAATLPGELSGKYIHLLKNRNTGGAGGFTRGLIKLHSLNPASGFTHALFMDDDVIVDPESVFRTHRLLALRKPQYEDVFIGGAMLRLDDRKVQVESGALWNAGNLISRKAGYDLSSPLLCLINETEQPVDYNAWWYCAFPLPLANCENLPLPLFIRGDDVEYGLRNMKQLILLNGVCVWHEPFENKYASSMLYYILRNRLIGNAARGIYYGKFRAYRDLAHSYIREVLCCRYRNADLLGSAANDFLKGVSWLKAQDGERLHREIIQSGYQMLPLKELHISRENYDICPFQRGSNPIIRLLQLLTCNGCLLPAKRRIEVLAHSATPINFFRAGEALNLNADGQAGFLTKRSLREALRCAGGLLRLGFRFLTGYDSAVKDYRKNAHELTTSAFWTQYLQLKGN